jgi:RNA polymerase sigma factor (sigma-70 family)
MSPKESEKIESAYRSERKKLLGYIGKRIPDRMEAEDILQDIFYQLTVGFNDIRRIENLTAWLFRVADNKIIDIFRRKKHITVDFKQNSYNGEDGPLELQEILPSKETSPDDEEFNDMVWETIDETLAELPEEQRTVFIQNEFENMSFREISEKTGVGINTLISRKRYAVLALRENLNELYKSLNNH